MPSEVYRPTLRWHGGKWILAPWVIEHFPPHRLYVEPYGGAASVLLRKERSFAEIYNDLDEEVVSFFRILQDERRAAELRRRLEVTPFARGEFEIGWAKPRSQIERARRLVIRAFMGFGSNAHSSLDRGHRATGFRASSNRSGSPPAADWANYPDAIPSFVARLRGVVIERRPAIQVMAQHDGPETLHYVDPPYPHSTRSRANPYDSRYRMYRHEMSDRDHEELLEFLKSLRGMVVLSSYPSELYDRALSAVWVKEEREAMADGARPRTEVLWINPACAAALERQRNQLDLFEAAE